MNCLVVKEFNLSLPYPIGFTSFFKSGSIVIPKPQVIVLKTTRQNAMYWPYFLRVQQTAEALGRKFPSLIYQMVTYE